jgi:hypothetical protein
VQIDEVTSSTPTGRPAAFASSATQKEWMSPVSTTGFAARWFASAAKKRSRAGG